MLLKFLGSCFVSLCFIFLFLVKGLLWDTNLTFWGLKKEIYRSNLAEVSAPKPFWNLNIISFLPSTEIGDEKWLYLKAYKPWILYISSTYRLKTDKFFCAWFINIYNLLSFTDNRIRFNTQLTEKSLASQYTSPKFLLTEFVIQVHLHRHIYIYVATKSNIFC